MKMNLGLSVCAVGAAHECWQSPGEQERTDAHVGTALEHAASDVSAVVAIFQCLGKRIDIVKALIQLDLRRVPALAGESFVMNVWSPSGWVPVVECRHDP